MYDVLADVRKTLATYLNDPALGVQPAVGPAATKPVRVFDDMPNPRTKFADRVVAVNIPDQILDVRYWSPREFALTEDAPGAVTGRVQYSFGRFKLDIQIDVWGQYDDHRSEVVRALSTVLHRHPQVTLPGGDGMPRPARWHELSLLAGTLPGGLFAYRFDDTQVDADTGETQQSGEFRSTLMGRVYGLLTTEEACGILRSIDVTAEVTDGTGTVIEVDTITDP